MKLELLTGARCGEISGLCAEEIDRDEWTWTLPAARSKNKRPRVTPLVGVARQIIEARLSTVQAGPLFTAETGTVLTAAHIGHYLLARRDKLPIDKFTTHDLRRTVATMLAEMGIAARSRRRGGRSRGWRQGDADAGPALRSHGPDRAQSLTCCALGMSDCRAS